MKALVIGGTGPSGAPIVRGLIERGYEPVILHRGAHEVDEIMHLEHIHVDPHFEETLREGLGSRTFDVVLAMYGRLRLLPSVLAGVSDRVISVGGTVFKSIQSQPAGEDDPRMDNHKLYLRIVETEQVLAKAHEDGVFNLTHFRYPNLFGPRQLAPREWSMIRRLLDGRRRFAVLDGGLTLESRAYVDNAAHAVLLAVDKPMGSAGQMYNVADERTQSDADRLLTTAAIMGIDDIELVSFPPEAGIPAWYWGVGRSLTWSREGEPPSTEHQLLSVDKMVDQLGYHDVVDFETAMRETVEWYLAHRPEPGGEEERQIGDPFDYAAEDAFLAAHDEFVAKCESLPFAGVDYHHPYAHPKGPAKSSAS
ncbi:MAG: NAD-dependent epimerase/dehydratase family protein [Propionibacteriales bacterium]|nr:NAD-dependent epimerase/dehydratase family protein [Propionibacteriales bacterium]